LTEAKPFREISEDKKLVAKNIEKLARGITDVALWLDCDREGEAICFEVLRIVQAVNKNVKVHRAVFSANTRQDIQNAVRNMRAPDIN
jgi:DNA topoisomerase III